MLTPGLQLETEKLKKSWEQYTEEMLRDYLVQEVEDPRINVQSILTRHFLVQQLAGDVFGPLMIEELRFATVANWLLRLSKTGAEPDEFRAVAHALSCGADDAEGMPIPRFILAAWQALPATSVGLAVPNYLQSFLDLRCAEPGPKGLPAEFVTTFQTLWRSVLAEQTFQVRAVLEPACGSANDYRYLHAFGLAPFLDYAGFDLCEANVQNARSLFPGTRFDVGNAFAIDASDRQYDLTFVHDLFEHLSIEGLERAVPELCRVTRGAICVGFFNMHEEPNHAVSPVDEYHWNRLSMEKTRRLFEAGGFQVEPLHIGTFLKLRCQCDQTHNPTAYTFLCARTG